MADRIVQSSVPFVTTNATSQVIGTHAVPLNGMLQITATVAAMSSAGVTALWRKNALLKNVAGTVSLVAQADAFTPIKESGTTSWNVTPTLSQQDGAVISVVGAAGVTINWWIEMEGVEYLPNP